MGSQAGIEELIGEFFSGLKVANRYYSIQEKQPVLMLGEKTLYEAVKRIIEKAKSFC